MATKEEWKEYFELVNNREPTLAEFEAAKKNGEFSDVPNTENDFANTKGKNAQGDNSDKNKFQISGDQGPKINKSKKMVLIYLFIH